MVHVKKHHKISPYKLSTICQRLFVFFTFQSLTNDSTKIMESKQLIKTLQLSTSTLHDKSIKWKWKAACL